MAQTAFAFNTRPASPRALRPALPRPARPDSRAADAARISHPAAAQLAAEIAPAPLAATTELEPGYAIGWDHARHGLVPPPEHLLPGHPVRQGWDAGRAVFEGRPLWPASRAVQTWLALRLEAWHQGIAFEAIQLTPHFLAQLETDHCPITRQPLSNWPGQDSEAKISRLRESAAYAAGHLAVLSGLAVRAKAGLRWDEARLNAALAESRQDGLYLGLTAPQWQRLAVMISFVTPLPHEVAASLPLRVLPANRLRLLNPIQGLQALITRQLSQRGWSGRLARVAELLPAGPLRRDFHLLAHSLLPRAWDGGRPADGRQWQERLEDGWAQPQVLRRWQRFALQLDAPQAERLLQRMAEQGLAGPGWRLRQHSDEQAVEGWAAAAGEPLPSGVTVQRLALGLIQVRQVVETEHRQAAL